MKLPIVVNLFAGPGSGKSSLGAGVFFNLKMAGINCEMALEYAKDKVWEESFKVLNNQIYVFGKMHHKINRLKDQVDVIITDSPLLLCSLYAKDTEFTLKRLIKEEFDKFYNFNYFIERKKKYNPKGRMQTLKEAIELDKKLLKLLHSNFVTYDTIPGSIDGLDQITNDILGMFNKSKKNDSSTRIRH